MEKHGETLSSAGSQTVHLCLIQSLRQLDPGQLPKNPG